MQKQGYHGAVCDRLVIEQIKKTLRLYFVKVGSFFALDLGRIYTRAWVVIDDLPLNRR